MTHDTTLGSRGPGAYWRCLKKTNENSLMKGIYRANACEDKGRALKYFMQMTPDDTIESSEALTEPFIKTGRKNFVRRHREQVDAGP
ncbi:hypothetical protein EVAR_48844_1 [Eumeta japonica]|uniref:Uncharacterized protein n=1 Tax=Eumeta variegata TaxID=151549 RepID=A0A4C1YCV1_EUMVA|nr:hypothetical protein EVAR_48844_1 [Eumeta japonica]